MLYSLGSAVCALAPGAAVLGAGRRVSGLGGLMPVGPAVVAEFAPPRRAALATGHGGAGAAVPGAAAISLVPLARPGHRSTLPPSHSGRPSRP
ncbi:hypothetical protein [Streptomyces sp. NPDC047706]|uniref:hypothetical protein n=1 Tax=Streptomyces sp. NPDC047706 TaxID=3365486 RepID=UPI0037174980